MGFEVSRSILNDRPRIQYVEPDQVEGIQGSQQESQPIPIQTLSLESRLSRTEDLIAQYEGLERLAKIAEARLDQQASTATFCLDPVVDAHVIASLHRKFGNVKACITYEQYKKCLEDIERLTHTSVGNLTAEDLEDAASDPGRTHLGGFTDQMGALRPELQFQSPIPPLDIDKFQKDGTKKLFKMLLPMLTKLADAKILAHLAAQHG